MLDTQTASTARLHTTPVASPSLGQVAQAFIKEIQTWAPHRNPHQVFRAFAEIAALTIHQSPYHAGMLERDEAFDRIERAYMDAIKTYSADELDRLTQLYSLVFRAFTTYPASDVLGHVFMELDIHHKHSGQYFTPPSVSRAMAKMMLCDIGSLINQKGFATFDEPACGSGCMLIETANELYELGYNPQWSMIFQATDISRDCFNMAYLQLSLMNIPRIVVHGDTLRMEEWERRPTPMFAIMYPARIIKADETPIPTVPVLIAEPSPTPPDIQLPGEQISFNF